MITKSKHLIIGVILVVFSINSSSAQEYESENNKKMFERLVFFEYRGTNAFDLAIGASSVNGDLQKLTNDGGSEFGLYIRAGYKRYLADFLSLNLSYNKYDVAFKNGFNEGFMSFDLSLECLFFPYNKFSPFIQVGGGYNASDNFDNTATKAQGAFGFEYIVANRLGFKIFGEYNYMFSDEIDGLIAGESDDALYRLGFGVNLYFGGKKKRQKRLKKIETVIQSNLME